MRAWALGAALLASPLAAQAIDRSPAAARAVVVRYYAEIDRGDYRAAYALWNGGAPQPYPVFVNGYARTAHTRVTAGAPGDEEGAAGSVFITVPVQVYATLKNGARQHFAGSYVLRRVNDGIDAPPAEHGWHIFSASLHPAR